MFFFSFHHLLIYSFHIFNVVFRQPGKRKRTSHRIDQYRTHPIYTLSNRIHTVKAIMARNLYRCWKKTRCIEGFKKIFLIHCLFISCITLNSDMFVRAIIFSEEERKLFSCVLWETGVFHNLLERGIRYSNMTISSRVRCYDLRSTSLWFYYNRCAIKNEGVGIFTISFQVFIDSDWTFFRKIQRLILYKSIDKWVS
jgi:hypothetical protein